MPTARVTAPVGWGASGRVTASGDTSILIRNTDREPVYWAITANDTAPTFDVPLAHKIEPGEQYGLTLANTERLWYSGRSQAATITLTDGVAV
jgi:hypothetical protein